MKISVVIPAYNEELLLGRSVAALMPQATEAEAEVIVVNNSSTDATAEIARQAGATVVEETKRGYVFAMQRGLTAATGDIVAFTDADSRIEPGWLAVIQEAFNDPKVISVTGPIHFERMRWLSWWRFLSPTSTVGSNMAVRRSVALEAGGFDARYNLAGDLDLSRRLKGRGRMLYEPTMAVQTSARRFQAHPFREGARYILNYAWMTLFHRPLFWHFSAIRRSPQDLARQEQKNLWLVTMSITALIFFYLSLWPASSDFGQAASHGHTKEKLVALTFDDGPNGAATKQIVNILKTNNVPATFFEVGHSIAADPATSRYVYQAGFPIANHSWSHSYRLPYFSTKHIRAELADTSAEIKKVTGQNPIYFRPPHGFRSPQLLYEVRRAKLKTVDWTVDPQDYFTSDAKKIVRDVIDDVHPGSIVLLHDGLQDGPRSATLIQRRATIQALPQIISELHQRGYSFVSLDDLLRKTAHPTWAYRLRRHFLHLHPTAE